MHTINRSPSQSQRPRQSIPIITTININTNRYWHHLPRRCWQHQQQNQSDTTCTTTPILFPTTWDFRLQSPQKLRKSETAIKKRVIISTTTITVNTTTGIISISMLHSPHPSHTTVATATIPTGRVWGSVSTRHNRKRICILMFITMDLLLLTLTLMNRKDGMRMGLRCQRLWWGFPRGVIDCMCMCFSVLSIWIFRCFIYASISLVCGKAMAIISYTQSKMQPWKHRIIVKLSHKARTGGRA